MDQCTTGGARVTDVGDPGAGDLTTEGFLPYSEGELPLVHVACYLCGHDDGEVVLDDPPFKVIRCPECGLVYVTPRVPDSHLHLIYQTEYFTSSSAADFGYADYTHDHAKYLRTFRKKARLVQAHRASGRVLEVGSAAGFFLHAMGELGYEATGVEVSEYVSGFARRELGIERLHTGLLADAPLDPASFEIAAMWDVIEHVPDPIAELRRIHDLLVPEGLLFLQTQNVDHWFARLLGSKWQHFKQLEHIHHFSPRTIRTLLDRAGFEVLGISNRGAGKYISVEFFCDRMRRYSVLAHHLLWPARAFGRFFFYLNPGDEMIVVARRSSEENPESRG